MAGAGTGVVIFCSDDPQLRDMTFWGMGSLGGANWTRSCRRPSPSGRRRGWLLGRGLDALALGERAAASGLTWSG